MAKNKQTNKQTNKQEKQKKKFWFMRMLQIKIVLIFVP